MRAEGVQNIARARCAVGHFEGGAYLNETKLTVSLPLRVRALALLFFGLRPSAVWQGHRSPMQSEASQTQSEMTGDFSACSHCRMGAVAQFGRNHEWTRRHTNGTRLAHEVKGPRLRSIRVHSWFKLSHCRMRSLLDFVAE